MVTISWFVKIKVTPKTFLIIHHKIYVEMVWNLYFWRKEFLADILLGMALFLDNFQRFYKFFENCFCFWTLGQFTRAMHCTVLCREDYLSFPVFLFPQDFARIVSNPIIIIHFLKVHCISDQKNIHCLRKVLHGRLYIFPKSLSRKFWFPLPYGIRRSFSWFIFVSPQNFVRIISKTHHDNTFSKS